MIDHIFVAIDTIKTWMPFIRSQAEQVNSANQRTTSVAIPMIQPTQAPFLPSWSEPPTEVIQNIATFIDQPAQVGRLLTVSRHWRLMIDSNPAIWRELASRIGMHTHPHIQDILRPIYTPRVYYPPLSLENYLQPAFNYQQPAFVERAYKPEGFNREILENITEFYGEEVPELMAKQVATNPYPAIALGPKEWIASGLGDPGPVPHLPLNIHQLLQSPCPFIPGKTVEDTHLLVLIPATVTKIHQYDGLPHSFPLTSEIFWGFIGSHCEYGSEWHHNPESPPKVPIAWELINSSGNPHALYKIVTLPNYAVHQSRWVLVKKPTCGPRIEFRKAESEGYQLPSFMDAIVTLCLFRLFNRAPLMCEFRNCETYCQEEVEGRRLRLSEHDDYTSVRRGYFQKYYNGPCDPSDVYVKMI